MAEEDLRPQMVDVLIGMLLVAVVAASVGAAIVGLVWWLS